MRPVDKSKYTENREDYSDYGNAKPDLIKALGYYCSYCERKGYSSALDVEHIEDKSNHKEKKTLWSNFLLSCKNCNSIKSTKPIDFSKISFPHIHNTYKVFDYLESGFVAISSEIESEEKEKTKELIKLVGLDRRPGHPKYSHKDERWKERKECWEIATRYFSKYKNGKSDAETIIDLAQSKGFWSIWMRIFSDYPEIQRKLIDSFSGTNTRFFEGILK